MRILIISLFFITLFSPNAYAIWPFTRESDGLSYYAPCWGENNKIYFIKKVTYGTYIAFTPFALLQMGRDSVDKIESYLCSMNYDGTDKKEIVKIGDTDKNTYWLPIYLDYCRVNDLLLLSGGSIPSGGHSQGIFTIRPDGTGLKRISDTGMHASWSPDGKKIAYQDGRNIWVMDVNGESKQMISKKVLVAIKAVKDEHGDIITQEGRYKAVEWEERFDDESPIWSPKGDLIAFVSNFWIWVMKSDGTERRRVIHGSLDDWFPDGTMLLGSISGGSAFVDLNGNVVKMTHASGRCLPDGEKLLVGLDIWDINNSRKIPRKEPFPIKGEHWQYKRPNNIW